LTNNTLNLVLKTHNCQLLNWGVSTGSETKVADSPTSVLYPSVTIVKPPLTAHWKLERETMDAALTLPRIDRLVCTGCGDCVDICHADALAIQELRAVIVNAGACDYCSECEAVCPIGAIACPFEVVVAG
jgi:ferredoxin